MISTCYTVNITSSIASTLTDFAVVPLAFLHCNTDGSLNYNNDPLTTTNNPGMLSGVQVLNDNFTVSLYSIGGTGGSDFVNIGNNYDTFYSNLTSVLDAYGVWGVDLDFENEPTTQIQDTIQQLVTDLTTDGYLVTAVPPNDGAESFWQTIVTNTIGSDETSPILFMNLQLYGGCTFDLWNTDFTGVVTDPAAFLGTGYLSGQLTPADITSALQTLINNNPTNAEAFIWRSPHVMGNATMSDYAQAINSVAANTSAVKALTARIEKHREARKGKVKKAV